METEESGGGPQLLECFPCTSNQQLSNRTCIDTEIPPQRTPTVYSPPEDSSTEESPTEDTPTLPEETPTEETQTGSPTGDGIETPLLNV